MPHTKRGPDYYGLPVSVRAHTLYTHAPTRLPKTKVVELVEVHRKMHIVMPFLETGACVKYHAVHPYG